MSNNGALFRPLTVSGLELPNRLVRAAVYEMLADEHGAVTPELVELYRELSAGGAGLIITGGALVHHTGRTIRKMISAHADSFADGLSKLADAVHEEGGRVALQLFHGGRHCPEKLIGWERAVAPSEVHDRATGKTPRALGQDEAWEMVNAFGQAAARARAAGFDAVEVHAAHGYLVGSFLSPRTNLRDDLWGGDEVRRAHFAEEVIKAVRWSVGEGFPILVKISANEHMPGGLGPDEAVRQARRMEFAGADLIEISGGTRESDPPILRKDSGGWYRPEGKLARLELTVPVMVTGGFRSRAAMEDALDKGEADLVGLARPLIREPGLPARMLREGHQAVSECVSCNKCSRYSRIDRVRCFDG